MLYTKNGWEEITHDDGVHRTYMAIFMPRGEDNWGEVIGYIPLIDKLVRQYKLQNAANISASAGVLTIAFQTTEGQQIPDVFREAGKVLSKLLVGAD